MKAVFGRLWPVALFAALMTLCSSAARPQAPDPPPVASRLAALEQEAARQRAALARLDAKLARIEAAVAGQPVPPVLRTVPVVDPPPVVTVRVAAPGVAAAGPFRPARPSGGGYNPSHSCPACGRAQYVVSGRGPRAGSHTHTCTRCGTAWWH